VKRRSHLFRAYFPEQRSTSCALGAQCEIAVCLGRLIRPRSDTARSPALHDWTLHKNRRTRSESLINIYQAVQIVAVPEARQIEVFKPLDEAFQLMKKILFQPVRLTKNGSSSVSRHGFRISGVEITISDSIEGLEGRSLASRPRQYD